MPSLKHSSIVLIKFNYDYGSLMTWGMSKTDKPNKPTVNDISFTFPAMKVARKVYSIAE